MRIVLVVCQDFADFKRGARIDDPQLVKELLDSHNISHVVVTQVSEDSIFSATTH